MRYFDYVRRVSPGMEEVAERWGIALLSNVKGVYEASSLKEAKSLLPRARAIFTLEVDAALASLASQKGVHLGLFVADLNEKNLGKAVKWVRIVQGSRVPILLASGARRVEEMIHPLDMAAIGRVLGLRPENSYAAVSKRWREILEGP